tara:strand:- start:197 stop:466 length:270 start_codon:yes stop_codon:yes gene_type:complete
MKRRNLDAWTRTAWGGHVLGNYHIRVITATIDGKGPMYWLYRNAGGGRCGWDGTTKNGYDFGEPVRSLRTAKRRVEKLWAEDRSLEVSK